LNTNQQFENVHTEPSNQTAPPASPWRKKKNRENHDKINEQ